MSNPITTRQYRHVSNEKKRKALDSPCKQGFCLTVAISAFVLRGIFVRCFCSDVESTFAQILRHNRTISSIGAEDSDIC